MQKLFLQRQIRELDAQTISTEDITSVELMERAARTVATWLDAHYQRHTAVVFAGPGNNGGDGLAVARMLRDSSWQVEVWLFTGSNGNLSDDNKANVARITETDITLHIDEIPSSIPPLSIVVDALLGTGVSRPTEGKIAECIEKINSSGCEVVSIDLPSGLPGEEELGSCAERTIVKADHTISFQFPKIAFFAPEANDYIGAWHVTDIGLSSEAIAATETPFRFTTIDDIAAMVRPRSRFAHKGTCGKALLVAGSYGMMGAAVLSSRACMRSGVGLLTTATVPEGYAIMQTAVPEAMTLTDSDLSAVKVDAVGIGPGLGRTPEAEERFRSFLNEFGGKKPMVIDADGLFHLAQMITNQPDFTLPANCVVTPHVVEFDRLTKQHSTFWERLIAARDFAQRHRTTVVLKGAFSAIACTDGLVVINTTGNSGMATAGSGDVLTGIVLALLAQGYSADEAAILAVNIHGAAGDVAATERSKESMIASDIVENIGKAFLVQKNG